MPCNVCFFDKPLGAMDIYPPTARCVNVAVGASSAVTSITANAGDIARIAATENCYVMAAPSVAAGAGAYLSAGDIITLGPMSQGDVVAVIGA